MIDRPCRECAGEGRRRADKIVEIDVPAGVAESNYLTLRGQGGAGIRGAPAGDLIVGLEFEDDPRFERHGDAVRAADVVRLKEDFAVTAFVAS